MPFRSVRAKEDSEIARDWRRLRRQVDSMCGILDWSLEQEMGGNGKTDAIQTQPMVQLKVLCQCPFPGSDNSAAIILKLHQRWLGEASSGAGCTSLYHLCKSKVISELFFL